MMTKNGITCRMDRRLVCLDPRIPDRSAVNFVSHAHTDHLPSRNGGVMLSSDETRRIAGLRGFDMEGHVDAVEGLSMVDAGHILGARGLLFDDIFYTGDICTRDRGFLRGARIPRCRILITECTFGLPEFTFPPIQDTQRRVNRMIAEFYEKGVPVILMGYQLGKAQTITQLFGHWEPLYLHDSVRDMNALHRELGMKLSEGIGHTEAEKRGLLEKKPWVMVTPMMSGKNGLIQDLKSKYGAVSIGFSGWAMSSRFAFGRRADYSIPMSDHCDFDELVDIAVRSGAEHVYTVHGFVGEFARHLQGLGISASPLAANSLENFV